MALVAVAAHAATFNSPNNNSITPCSGGFSSSGNLFGYPNSSGGVSVYGTATLSGASGGACSFLLTWKGTGSGSFAGTTPTFDAGFTITPPDDAYVSSYTLTILINGTQAGQSTCTHSVTQAAGSNAVIKPRIFITCTSVSLPSTSLTVPATLSTYEVDLAINTQWTDTTSSSFTVTIPGGATIDIDAPLTATPAAPAMSPIALGMTLLLLGVVAYQRM